MGRWLANNAIQDELADVLRDREAIWAQMSPSKDRPFWCRRTRVNSAKSIQYWLDSLQFPYYSVGLFMGTNVINWDAMPMQPPPLRAKGNLRTEHKNAWEKYLTPKGCKELGLDWEDIWVAKSMLFDFDHKETPMVALDRAVKTATYLRDDLDCSPMMVFSGSKGFHVHVNPEEASILTDCIPTDFIEKKDPLRDLGKHYASVVEQIAKDATRVKFPIEDRSSNFRQGIVRCPYSIHPKTGQVVWPLDNRDVENLQGLGEDASIEDIAKRLHAWDIPNQSSFATDYDLTYIPPESRCIGRGMPSFTL
tara:strand:+ start:300 stop:1220 length:921 start_codon:yes stop_codon:yes gene_type:complete